MKTKGWLSNSIATCGIICCLTNFVSTSILEDALPYTETLQNLIKPQIDRLFFNQIDPDKPQGFFGLALSYKFNAPIYTFTDFTGLVQFAYGIGLPFSIYYDVVEERSDTEEATFRRRREAREVREEKHNFFQSMEGLVASASVPARACILRTICEVAEIPFAEGFFGDSLNALLRASSVGRTEEPDEDHSFNDYVDAEVHGRSKGECHNAYSECHTSLFNLFFKDSHVINEM